MGLAEDRLQLFADAGVPLTPRVVRDREGREIYLAERGQGDPVIVVHGGGGELGGWLPLLPHLGEERRWILVDRPGHGLSYGIDYRGSDYRRLAAEFLEDVLDGLELPAATLLGNSMGGFFSLAFALAHPERVRELVLVGAPAGLDRWIPWPLRIMATPGLNRLLERLQGEPTPQKMRETVFSLLVADPSRMPDASLEIGGRMMQQPKMALAWRSLLERVLNLRGFRPALMIREETAALALPTVFVWGDEDAFAPPSSGEDLVTRMPDARLHVVPGAGHLPWVDAPEAVARHVLDFLEAQRRAA